MLPANFNRKFYNTVFLLLLIFAVSGCGTFSKLSSKISGKSNKPVEKEIRLSPDILNKIGLSERWVIKSLGGDQTTIMNIEKQGNNLLVFNSDSKMYCISMVTGGVKWEKRFMRKFGNLAEISFYQNRVLVVLNNQVYELNMDNGVETNHWEMPFSPTTSAARDEGLLFIGATDKRFYCLKLPLLTQVWKSLQSKQVKGKIWLDTRKEGEETVGNVYFSCDDGSVYAARYDKRELMWSLKTSGDVPGCVYNNNQCFVPSTDTALYCVDSTSGNIFWKYLAGGKMYDVPAVTDNYVYQTILNKSMVCLERFPNGVKPGADIERLEPSIVWEYPKGAKFLCESGERVFITNDAGQLVIMNSRTQNKEYSVYLKDIDLFYSNTQDDLLILASKTGDIMVLQPVR